MRSCRAGGAIRRIVHGAAVAGLGVGSRTIRFGPVAPAAAAARLSKPPTVVCPVTVVAVVSTTSLSVGPVAVGAADPVPAGVADPVTPTANRPSSPTCIRVSPDGAATVSPTSPMYGRAPPTDPVCVSSRPRYTGHLRVG